MKKNLIRRLCIPIQTSVSHWHMRQGEYNVHAHAAYTHPHNACTRSINTPAAKCTRRMNTLQNACTRGMHAPAACMHPQHKCTHSILTPAAYLHQQYTCTRVIHAPAAYMHPQHKCNLQIALLTVLQRFYVQVFDFFSFFLRLGLQRWSFCKKWSADLFI